MRAAGRGEEGHIGFDKWTVKVPIWPSLWLFLPALLSTLVLYYPFSFPSSVVHWAGVKASRPVVKD